jgi:murein DD-endopeptidase MepM/ murein hydrolase activator NlpD
MRFFLGALAALILPVSVLPGQTEKSVIDLGLPTENDGLFHKDGPGFYQYIDRDYKGVKSKPWEGGQYGFVRDPIETPAGLIYTRFHEGMDIRPLYRDARGEPLDEIHAIADGKVVHVNPVPGYSNYGRYIVIEHRWDGSNYYSLYGHLSSVSVAPGQEVHKGDVIALMGYTGVGINRERAHVHLELNLMLSHQFEAWHDANFKTDPNHNGIYNGINLTGMDIARLYLALRKNPSLTIPQFFESEETFYKVTLPPSAHFELPILYPWMLQGRSDAHPVAWEVSFDRSGMPLQIHPSNKPVTEPELTYVKKSPVDYKLLTRGAVTGRNGHGVLTDSGKKLMRLLIYPD